MKAPEKDEQSDEEKSTGLEVTGVNVSVEDLAGLKQPLTVLVKYVLTGVGRACEPIWTRFNASADASKIRKIGGAINEVGKDLSSAEYQDGKVKLIARPAPLNLANSTLEERAQVRVSHQAIKEQKNLEQIVSVAAEQLKNEESVPEQPANEDWVHRFFETSAKISDKEMQQIWAKILAGEIRRPGKFSFRTLDLVKNLTKEEAEIFEFTSQYTAYSPAYDWAVIPTVHNEIPDKPLTFEHMVMLQEAGLIHPTVMTHTFNVQPSLKKNSITFFHRGKYVTGSRKSYETAVNVRGYSYTKPGLDLLSLISFTEPVHMPTIELLIKMCGNSVRRWKYGEVLKVGDGEYTPGSVVEIFYDCHVRGQGGPY